MYQVTFDLRAFGMGGKELSREILTALLYGLTAIDCAILRRFPRIPPLYRSGVRYQLERLGEDHWQDVAQTLKRGVGDCEDLASWRAAELIVRTGTAARPYVLPPKRLPHGVSLYHIIVRYPDGKTEDPSRVLGMGKNAETMPVRRAGLQEVA